MLFTIATSYLWWHYTQATSTVFHLWLNFLWFFGHYFSIVPLLSSLFAPWKRVTVEHNKKWNLEDLAGTIAVNMMSRVFGAVLRLFVIMLGLLVLSLAFISIVPVFLFWLTAPLMLVGFLGYGLVLIF